MHPLDVHDIAVTLNADSRALRVPLVCARERHPAGASRGLSGIDEIKQLFGAKTLTVDTGADNAAGKLTFNIDAGKGDCPPALPATGRENKNMAMDLRDPNVWITHLLENLPEEKLASALKDDNPDWGVYRRRNRQTGISGPTVNWISRNSSAGGWSFWLRRVSICCWRIC